MTLDAPRFALASDLLVHFSRGSFKERADGIALVMYVVVSPTTYCGISTDLLRVDTHLNPIDPTLPVCPECKRQAIKEITGA